MDLDLDLQALAPLPRAEIGDRQGDEAAALREELREARARADELAAALARSGASNSLLFATLDAAADGFVAFQFEDNALFFNTAFVKMWRIPEDMLSRLGHDELRALQCAQARHPDDLAEYTSSFDPDAEDFNIIELKDGRIFERHARPQRVHGRSVGRVIVYRDVTQRVQFEQKMMFNHVVVECSGPMIWIEKGIGLVRYANRAACELLGYGLEEVIGKMVGDIDANYTPETLKPHAEKLATTGKPVHFRTRYRHRAGRLLNVDVTASLTDDGEREIYIVSFKDITEQTVAALERKRQQALLAALIDSIPDIISYRDPSGAFLGCNQAFSELRGGSVVDVTGRMPEELFPPERARIIRSRDAQVLSTLDKFALEERVAYPDGTEVLLETVRSPLRDQNGNLLGVLAIGRDVTQRARLEQKMKFNQVVVESSGPMVWVDHASRRITYGNPAACELLGYELDELMARHIEQVAVNYSARTLAPIDEQLRATGKPLNFPTVCRRKNGELLDIDATASLTGHGESDTYVFSFKDITQQKIAERENARQRGLLTSLINSIPDIISYRDPQGIFLGCNDAFAAFRGMTVSDVTGRTCAELFPQEVVELVRSRDDEVLRTLQTLVVEEPVVATDGSDMILQTVRSPMRDDKGQRAGRPGDRPRRDAAKPRRGGNPPRQGDGRGSDAPEDRFPGQHEPRDPHADERDHRHVAPGPEDGPDAAPARLHRQGPAVGPAPAGHHQRHPGLLEGRGRQAHDRAQPSSSWRRCWTTLPTSSRTRATPRASSSSSTWAPMCRRGWWATRCGSGRS